MPVDELWESVDGNVKVIHYEREYDENSCYVVRDCKRMIIDRRFWYEKPGDENEEEARQMAVEHARDYHEKWYGS